MVVERRCPECGTIVRYYEESKSIEIIVSKSHVAVGCNVTCEVCRKWILEVQGLQQQSSG